MRIMGYHVNGGKVTTSTGKDSSGQSLLEFLVQPEPDTIRVMYDLDHSAARALAIAGIDSPEIKSMSGDSRGLTFYLAPYHIRYIKGKLFSVKRVGAFAYYANASRYTPYPPEDLGLEGSVLANRARETGEQVLQILQGLELNPTSLVNPARAYEKKQIQWLYNEKINADGNPVKAGIIEEIGFDIYGRTWQDFCAAKGKR